LLTYEDVTPFFLFPYPLTPSSPPRGEGKGEGMTLLVYCLRKNFTHFVIPDLIRNPVFLIWIPAEVYPVLDTGRE